MEDWIGILVWVVIAIIATVSRSNRKKKKKQIPKPVTRSKPQPKPTQQTTTASQPKSVEDIFKDFVKEIEQSKTNKKTTTTEKQVKPSDTSKKYTDKKSFNKSEAIEAHRQHKTPNWQTASKHDKPLIDYTKIEHSSLRKDSKPIKVESVKSVTEEGYEFDLEEAIIGQVILERKYT